MIPLITKQFCDGFDSEVSRETSILIKDSVKSYHCFYNICSFLDHKTVAKKPKAITRKINGHWTAGPRCLFPSCLACLALPLFCSNTAPHQNLCLELKFFSHILSSFIKLLFWTCFLSIFAWSLFIASLCLIILKPSNQNAHCDFGLFSTLRI